MCERVRDDVALGLSLQSIVSDRRRGLHRRFNIARLNESPPFFRMVCPYTGKTICLQFDAHLKLIGLDFVHSTLSLLNLGENAQQILDVMTNFVGNHVSLRELTALAADIAAPEAPRKISEEGGVEIDLLVVRTVEGAHRRLGHPAGRARHPGEHDQGRCGVALAGLREDFLPLNFRTS